MLLFAANNRPDRPPPRTKENELS